MLSHSRAKVKNEAKKVAAIRHTNTPNDSADKSAPSSLSSPSPAPQPTLEAADDAQKGLPDTGNSEGSDGSSVSGDTETPGISAPENEEDIPAPSLPTVNIELTSPFDESSDDLSSVSSAPVGDAETTFYNERSQQSPSQLYSTQSLVLLANDFLALRRGSLPNLPLNSGSNPMESLDLSLRTNAYGAGNTYNSPAVPYDAQGRRASIATTDSHAMRLSTHPYAHLARAANSGRAPGYGMLSLRPSPSPSPTHSPASRLHSIAHSPSHNALRRASIAAGMDLGQFPPPPAMMRAYTQPAGMGMDVYTGSSRAVPAPPPGPLPEQGFSFGAPPPGYESHGSMSSEPEEEQERYAEWERVRGGERLGSVASVASFASGVSEFGGAGGSESSWTSWYRSEEGGNSKEGEMEGRRGSW